MSSVRLFHSVSSYQWTSKEKAMKCLTPRYKSITFLGDQFQTKKSCPFAIPAALITYFTKYFIFVNLCFPPFTCLTYFALSILQGGIFLDISPKNHISNMFVNVIYGIEKEVWVRRMLPPRQFPHEIFIPLVSFTIYVSATGGVIPPPPPLPSTSNYS